LPGSDRQPVVRAEPAFSYSLHVPAATRSRCPLLVVVHDTTRNARGCRDAFATFAERYGCIVLAPLFPAEASGPAAPDNYKFIAWQRLRFDRLLLDMVAEVADTYPVDGDRFGLHGFSGGAQFVHRFLYLHPERVAAVSVAAPGRVTPLDLSKTWWAGVGNVPEVFGRPVDLAALRAVPVQVLVGADDTGPVEPGDPEGYAGATGRTRVQRAGFLHASLAGHGVRSRLDVVPGAGHEHAPLLPHAQRFLAEHLAR
jgi:poly(3-hydroxybutyrate) depolymerase